jgi:hypothetical protein
MALTADRVKTNIHDTRGNKTFGQQSRKKVRQCIVRIITPRVNVLIQCIQYGFFVRFSSCKASCTHNMNE